jgi:hypothetical protein
MHGWTTADRAALLDLVNAKAAASERRFARALAAHARLQTALARLS